MAKIGFDFRKTNSLAACWSDKGAALIPNVLHLQLTKIPLKNDFLGGITWH